METRVWVEGLIIRTLWGAGEASRSRHVIKKYLFPAKMAFWSTIDVFRRRPVSALVSTAAAISAAGLVFLIGAVVVAWLGIYDIAATKGHNAVFAWFLHFTMRNSVKAHAPPA